MFSIAFFWFTIDAPYFDVPPQIMATTDFSGNHTNTSTSGGQIWKKKHKIATPNGQQWRNVALNHQI